MYRKHYLKLILAAGVSMSLLTTACGASTGNSDSASQETVTSQEPEQESTVEDEAVPSVEESDVESTEEAVATDENMVVPGYQLGEIPAIIMPTVPNLGLAETVDAKISINAMEEISSVPGITVTLVQIEDGNIVDGSTTVQTDENGGGQYVDSDVTLQTDGDGSGQYSDGYVTIQTDGNGAGQYMNSLTGVTLQVDETGSGQYIDETNGISLQVDEDGSGMYTDTQNDISLMVGSDLSATYTEGSVTISNNGDGSGSYYNSETGLQIENDGMGTATVSYETQEVTVDAEPLEAVSGFAKLEPVPAVPSIEANGLLINLDSGVLFDVDQYDIREDAEEVLTNLATVLTEAEIESFVINGHTDSDASDEHNQVLSENRANSVKTFLESQGVQASITTNGYGESQPIASNDTAEGKQKNRRVEIVVPTT